MNFYSKKLDAIKSCERCYVDMKYACNGVWVIVAVGGSRI